MRAKKKKAILDAKICEDFAEIWLKFDKNLTKIPPPKWCPLASVWGWEEADKGHRERLRDQRPDVRDEIQDEDLALENAAQVQTAHQAL